MVGSSGLVFGVRFREGFLGPEWGALERYVLVVCLEVAQFLTLDLEARASWPAANSLNLSLRPSLGLGPGVGTAGVPEPGLMGRRPSRACSRLRTLWRRPSWVRIPPPAPDFALTVRRMSILRRIGAFDELRVRVDVPEVQGTTVVGLHTTIRPDGLTEVVRFPASVKPFTLGTVIETLAEEPVLKLTLLRLAATVMANCCDRNQRWKLYTKAVARC